MADCIHGLDTGWCSLCLHTAGPIEVVTVEATFPAKFDGDCPACNLPIMVGQTIHKLSNDRYIHKGCE